MSRAAFLLAYVIVAAAELMLPCAEVLAEPREIVVLPMTSTAKDLRLYERAISMALAKELSRVSRTRVLALPSASDVPKTALLIVEGRLVARGRGRVLLEARLRDAKTGRAIATMATEATELTNLDMLVAKLAARLMPAIAQGLAPPAPHVLPAVQVSPTSNAQVLAPAKLSTPGSLPPEVLLIPAAGSAARGVVSVREPATASAQEMLARLGFRAKTSDAFEGLQDVPGALAEMRQAGATYLLMINVREVQFSYRAILSARGTVQVAVLDNEGVPVFARTVSTDTVVGSRGDRHRALVYQVATQALDMLLPEFRKLASAQSAQVKR